MKRHARLSALIALLLLLAPMAQAARIVIDPAAKLVSCTAAACDAIAVQVLLGAGETGVDSFFFDITVSAPGLVGLTPGPLAGNPLPGFNGGVVLLNDGVTVRGALGSVPVSFDGPLVLVASIPLRANAALGTADFRYADAEIACATCNGGAGAIYPNDNPDGQLLATVTVAAVPEPTTLALLGAGLALLGGSRRRV